MLSMYMYILNQCKISSFRMYWLPVILLPTDNDFLLSLLRICYLFRLVFYINDFIYISLALSLVCNTYRCAAIQAGENITTQHSMSDLLKPAKMR